MSYKKRIAQHHDTGGAYDDGNDEKEAYVVNAEETVVRKKVVQCYLSLKQI